MIHLTLPFPHKDLNPNAIKHWTHKAKLKKQQMSDVRWCFLAEVCGPLDTSGNIPVSFVFHPPDKRGRDIDNLLASMKAAIDQIAISLKVNDKQFRPITIDMGEVRKPAVVEITIGGK